MRKSFSASAGVSAEVGSSRMSSLQVGGEGPGDLDELQLGDREAGDQRMRIDGDAELAERRLWRGRTSPCGRRCRSAVTGALPIAMFSATSRWGKSLGSW